MLPSMRVDVRSEYDRSDRWRNPGWLCLAARTWTEAYDSNRRTAQFELCSASDPGSKIVEFQNTQDTESNSVAWETGETRPQYGAEELNLDRRSGACAFGVCLSHLASRLDTTCSSHIGSDNVCVQRRRRSFHRGPCRWRNSWVLASGPHGAARIGLALTLLCALGLAAVATEGVDGALLFVAEMGTEYSGFGLLVARQALLVATLLAPMTVAFGAVFPFAVAVGMKTNDRIVSDLGILYALNTIGAVIGALLTGFVPHPVAWTA